MSKQGRLESLPQGVCDLFLAFVHLDELVRVEECSRKSDNPFFRSRLGLQPVGLKPASALIICRGELSDEAIGGHSHVTTNRVTAQNARVAVLTKVTLGVRDAANSVVGVVQDRHLPVRPVGQGVHRALVCCATCCATNCVAAPAHDLVPDTCDAAGAVGLNREAGKAASHSGHTELAEGVLPLTVDTPTREQHTIVPKADDDQQNLLRLVKVAAAPRRPAFAVKR